MELSSLVLYQEFHVLLVIEGDHDSAGGIVMPYVIYYTSYYCYILLLRMRIVPFLLPLIWKDGVICHNPKLGAIKGLNGYTFKQQYAKSLGMLVLMESKWSHVANVQAVSEEPAASRGLVSMASLILRWEMSELTPRVEIWQISIAGGVAFLPVEGEGK